VDFRPEGFSDEAPGLMESTSAVSLGVRPTRFYDRLRIGMRVDDFLSDLSRVNQFVHAAGMTHMYRLAAGPTKRLSDEIWPVARWATSHAGPEDRIQFPLSNEPPDCKIWRPGIAEPGTIEVTVAGAKERRFTMLELNREGVGRGFMGLSDDEPDNRFHEEIRRGGRAYSSTEAQAALTTAVKRCLKRKSRGSYANTLVIEANTKVVPESMWTDIRASLLAAVRESTFREIFVVGPGSPSHVCIQLK